VVVVVFQGPAENTSLPSTVDAVVPVVDPGTTSLTGAQIDEILGERNKYRALHESHALEWDGYLALDAGRSLVNCRPFTFRSSVCVFSFFVKSRMEHVHECRDRLLPSN
jgi:hypothetical protein